MTTFAISDPRFWESVTSSSEHWRAAAAAAAGIRMASRHLGDPNDGEAPVAALLQLPPGGVIANHAHDCYRMEVQIAGSLISLDGETTGPGDVRVSGPGEFYGPYTAGSEGSLTVEIFSRASRRAIWGENTPEVLEQIQRSEAEAAKWSARLGVE